MDDDFGLLPDQQAAPPPPRPPLGLVLAGLILVAVVAVGGVFWLVASLADRGRAVNAAGTPSPAAATRAAPTPPITAPVPTVPPATVAPTTAAPVRSAATIAPARTVVKRPPAPTTRPAPRPTLSVPVGKVVAVPGVVGLKVQQAGTVLRAAGLRVQVIGGVLDPERDDRRIVAQRPGAGSLVLAGSTVILVTDGT